MILPEALYDTEVAKHLGDYKGEFATLVLTISSIFEPFMPLHHRDTIRKVNFTYYAVQLEGEKCILLFPLVIYVINCVNIIY